MMARRETVSLRDYMEQRFAAVRDSIAAERRDLERRLDGMNELRAQITSERGIYATREMLDARLAELNSRLNLLERGSANLSGRYAILAVVATLVLTTLATLAVRALSR